MLATLAGPGTASAHGLSNRLGDFCGGMLHPATAPKHALPILALGPLPASRARAARFLLLALSLALLLGAALATVAPALS